MGTSFKLHMHFFNCTLPHVFVLILVGVVTCAGAPQAALGSAKCAFDGKMYDIGQTWYRRLTTPSADFCVHCLCNDGSRVNCSTVNCSKPACEGSQDSECCKSCEGTSKTEMDTGTQTAICEHNGQLYREGQRFSPNSSSLLTRQPNQCMECLCQNGLVLCSLKTCRFPCLSSRSSDEDCCSSCYSENSLISVRTSMQGDEMTQNKDCIATGVTYFHGSTWHPLIGPFGPMDCVLCKCQNAKIDCSRLECPEFHEQRCSKKIQVPGQCCPVCVEEGTKSFLDSKIVNPNHFRVVPSVTPELMDTSAAGDFESFQCLPFRTNTLVYRSHASSSTSGYYQFAFQTTGTDRNTRLLSWTIKDGHIGDFSEQYLTREEFAVLTKTFSFKLQGATRTKFMDKFIRKAKRLPERCDNRCAAKVRRLEEVLHLRPTTKRPMCMSEETAFD